MGHFPRPRLIAIHPARQGSDRANIDAGPALVALEMIAHVRRDLGYHPAVDHTERPNPHSFVADTNAAEAQNAPRSVEKHHRGKLLLRRVDLLFRIAAFARPVTEDHVLQLAFAALI